MVEKESVMRRGKSKKADQKRVQGDKKRDIGKKRTGGKEKGKRDSKSREKRKE